MAIIGLIISSLVALADLCLWVQRKNEKDKETKRREQRREQGRERQGDGCRVCLAAGTGEAVSGGEGGPEVPSGGVGARPMLLNNNDGKDDGDDDDKPKWPVKWIMILDFLLVGVLFWILLWMLAAPIYPYWYYNPVGEFWKHYATVPMGYSMVLHARCWWRQFRAREKAAWLRGLISEVNGAGRGQDLEAGLQQRFAGNSAGRNNETRRAGIESSGSTAGGSSTVVESTKDLADAIKATVHQLNQESRKALSSKNWLPGVSDLGERRPLLSHESAHACTQHGGYNDHRCAYPSAHVCQPTQPESSTAGHVCVHGHNNPATNKNKTGGHLTSKGEVKPVGADRSNTNLTPSDSGDTSDTSSSSTDLSESHVNLGKFDKNETHHDTGFQGQGVVDELTSRPRNSKAALIYDNDDDDADIMVVKKSKKGKSKAQKGKKRDIEFEE